MPDSLYPPASRALSDTRKRLAPEIDDAFQAFSQKVFADGALPIKTKQLIAVAVAHVTQCPYCIRGHTKAAMRHGATREELMEAIWVAGRDARRRRIHAFGPRFRRDEESLAARMAPRAGSKLAGCRRTRFRPRTRLRAFLPLGCAFLSQSHSKRR